MTCRSWAGDRFGVGLVDVRTPVGVGLADLIEIGLRRNPRRAQLLVSTVLGKHLAVDPRVAAGFGRLLGALVARRLAGQDETPPPTWSAAARSTIRGVQPGALLDLTLDLATVDLAAVDLATVDLAAGTGADHSGVLVLGFAETATALGHLVADQLPGAAYLHSTRRRVPGMTVSAEFSEPHSHAVGHLLSPRTPSLLAGQGAVVLVDDELSTGRTALNVITELQAIRPRSRYVLAGLVDVRSTADDRTRAEVAHRLGCRIDVVSLVAGRIELPPTWSSGWRRNSATAPTGRSSCRSVHPQNRAASNRGTSNRAASTCPGRPTCRRGAGTGCCQTNDPDSTAR